MTDRTELNRADLLQIVGSAIHRAHSGEDPAVVYIEAFAAIERLEAAEAKR